MSDETTPQDDAAMSPASAGSVGEPAAWGVLRVGGGWVSILANEVQAETSRKSFDRMENWVHEIVPLYRSPTLTDAERQAIAQLRKWAYEIARDNAFIDEVTDAADAAHKALTSFLERHK